MALRSFADGTLFAQVTGTSPSRVLALHGWARRGSDIASVIQGIDAITPDLPGFGASPVPDEVLGAKGYAKAVAPLLDECDEPPVLLGHSFGGRVAVCLATAYPDRVGPLVLSGVPLVRRAPSGRSNLTYRTVKALNRVGIVSDSRLEAEKKRRGSADYRAVSGVMRDILVKVVNESYEDQLRQLRSPVHLIWGELDGEVPLVVAETARDIMKEAGVEVTLTVLPGVGHLTPVEAPDQLRQAVVEALNR